MNTAQRLDLLKLSVELAKAEPITANGSDAPLAQRTIEVFRALKGVLDDGSVLGETNINDVKSAVDVAASIEDLIE